MGFELGQVDETNEFWMMWRIKDLIRTKVVNSYFISFWAICLCRAWADRIDAELWTDPVE